MKRQKQVFTPNELVEVWLRQSQPEGRTSGNGNFYFTGDTIYSYGGHFPIARIFDAPNGREGEIALVTTRTVSSSTARHMQYVFRALCASPLKIVYCANPVTPKHEEELANFESQCIRAGEPLRKARKPENHTYAVRTPAERALHYAETMGVEAPLWATRIMDTDSVPALLLVVEGQYEMAKAVDLLEN